MHRYGLRVFVIVSLMLLLLACGGAAQPESEPSTPEPDPTSAPVEEAAEEEAAEPTAVPEGEAEAEVMEPAAITIGFGGTIPLSHPGMYVPEVHGFWEDEMLDVTVEGGQGSVTILQLLDSGQVDFAQVTPESAILARSQGIRTVSVYTVNKFSSKLCVDANSSIQSVEELEGGTVGIPDPTSGQVYFANAVLLNAGLDPATDVNYVPTGFGPAAAEALAQGDVDAIAYWGGYYIQTELMGYEYRCFELPGLELSPGHVLVTLEETVQNNPGLIERVGRAYAKSIVYADAHVEETVQAYWTAYPDSLAQDVPEEELLATSSQEVDRSLDDFFWDYEGWQPGYNNPEGWEALVQFMVDTEQIQESIPVEELITNEFVEAYNDFDASAISGQ